MPGLNQRTCHIKAFYQLSSEYVQALNRNNQRCLRLRFITTVTGLRQNRLPGGRLQIRHQTSHPLGNARVLRNKG